MKPELNRVMSISPHLHQAIQNVVREMTGAQLIKIEADPLYGISKHERWYPRATLVDTDLLVELNKAWREIKIMRLPFPPIRALEDAERGEIVRLGYTSSHGTNPLDGYFSAKEELKQGDRVEFDEEGFVYKA